MRGDGVRDSAPKNWGHISTFDVWDTCFNRSRTEVLRCSDVAHTAAGRPTPPCHRSSPPPPPVPPSFNPQARSILNGRDMAPDELASRPRQLSIVEM